MIGQSSSSLRGRAQLLCVLTLAACVAPGAVAQQRDTAGARRPALPKQACTCHPKPMGRPFTVHGTLSQYRAAPIVRIAVVGTRRLLGLKDGVPEWMQEDIEVPGSTLTADFLVCPLSRRKAETIQLVCIESASNMVVTQPR